MTNSNASAIATDTGSPYRLLALDMDGTLLDTHKRVTPATAEALRGLSARGLFSTIATGRCYKEITPHLEELSPVGYAVLANGSVVVDLHDGSVLLATTIPNEGALLAVRTALQNGCVVNLLTAKGAYLDPEDADRAAEFGLPQYRKLFREVDDPLGDPVEFLEAHPDEAVKLNLYHFTEEGRIRTRDALAQAGAPVQTAFAEAHSLEVTAPGVRKDSGIRHLCDQLGITMGQVVAVGDGDNDLDMLRSAGLGVAMANATPSALEAADTVTSADCDHDGVAEVIERYF